MEGAEFWTKVKKRLKELDKKQDWLASNSGLLVQTLRNNIHNDRLPSLKDTLSILKTLNLTWSESAGSLESIQTKKHHWLK